MSEEKRCSSINKAIIKKNKIIIKKDIKIKTTLIKNVYRRLIIIKSSYK